MGLSIQQVRPVPAIAGQKATIAEANCRAEELHSVRGVVRFRELCSHRQANLPRSYAGSKETVPGRDADWESTRIGSHAHRRLPKPRSCTGEPFGKVAAPPPVAGPPVAGPPVAGPPVAARCDSLSWVSLSLTPSGYKSIHGDEQWLHRQLLAERLRFPGFRDVAFGRPDAGSNQVTMWALPNCKSGALASRLETATPRSRHRLPCSMNQPPVDR